MLNKQNKLLEQLKELESVVIAFSGGIDSSYLAFMAKQILQDKAVAVTAMSAIMSEQEDISARKTAKEIDIKHIIMNVDELSLPEFVANDINRCYYCKRYRLDGISRWARENGFKWIVEGSNVDDLKDYRPGMKALKEFSNVLSPLEESGLTKKEIRGLAKEQGLSEWNKPSMPCLASRICYDIPINKEHLEQVERAEKIVQEYCRQGSFRVRHHGNLARIEVDKELHEVMVKKDVTQKLAEKLKELGFSFVVLDLEGFVSGSMNKLVKQ